MKLTTQFIVVFLTAISNIAFALDTPEPFEPNDKELAMQMTINVPDERLRFCFLTPYFVKAILQNLCPD
jgi:hypothetical protein